MLCNIVFEPLAYPVYVKNRIYSLHMQFLWLWKNADIGKLDFCLSFPHNNIQSAILEIQIIILRSILQALWELTDSYHSSSCNRAWEHLKILLIKMRFKGHRKNVLYVFKNYLAFQYSTLILPYWFIFPAQNKPCWAQALSLVNLSLCNK